MSTFAKDTTPLLQNDSKTTDRMPMTVITTEPYSTSTETTTSVAPKERMAALDQYRGFVVLCLLVVPLLGRLNAAPNIFKHKNNFFSLAGSLV